MIQASATRTTLRVAVLDCGRLPPAIAQRVGGYRELYEDVLVQGAKKLPGEKLPELVVTGYHVDTEPVYPALEDVDVVIVSGSKHNAYDSDPWILRLVDYVRETLAQDRVRLVGICFGHQIIARALGARVGVNDRGWEIAVVSFPLTGVGRKLFGKEELALQQYHRDVVLTRPVGVDVLGSTPVCENQGMYALRRLLTLQGHPEFSGQTVTELLDINLENGLHDEETHAEAQGRAGLPHDGAVVGAGVWRFLLEA